MTTALRDLPKYLVLGPVSTVRVEITLEAPACEIDVELDNPRPGRSFVLLLGQPGGPYVQRVRLAGRARIFFDPQTPGSYELLLANPQKEPVTLRLRGHDVVPAASAAGRGARRRASGPEGRDPPAHRARTRRKAGRVPTARRHAPDGPAS